MRNLVFCVLAFFSMIALVNAGENPRTIPMSDLLEDSQELVTESGEPQHEVFDFPISRACLGIDSVEQWLRPESRPGYFDVLWVR